MTIPTRNAAISTASAIISAPDEYALIDIEPTGASANDQAAEIAVFSPDGTQLFYSLLKPSVSLSPKVTTAYGLTAAKLANAKTFTDVYEALALAISGKTLVAYNAKFDCRILASTCEAFGLEPFENEFVCAMELKRQYDGGNPGTLGGDHTAVGDCKTMILMLRSMAQTEYEHVELDEVTPDLLVELEGIQKQIKALAARKETIRAAVIAKLRADGNECYLPGNGLVFKNEPHTKFTVAEGVNVIDIDPVYVKVELNELALRVAYAAGITVKGVEMHKHPHFALRRPKVRLGIRRK